MEYVHTAGELAAYLLAGALCLVGIVMSCLSLSGTWLVVIASAIAAALPRQGFPGWWVVAVFAAVSGLVEIAEAVAGSWGVTRRGGSRSAGAAAIAGGLLGMVLGGFVPPPIVGSMLGMLAGSFLFAFAVERYRLKRSADAAARIAMGAVMARIVVVFLKALATLGMTAYLVLGLISR